MSKKKRSNTNTAKQKSQFSGIWLVILLALIGAGVMTYLALKNIPTGVAVPIMGDTSHIPEGSDPNPYNSNPPTSGIHYPEDLKAGFYPENIYEYPEGYLVHNLEHGYVIFWYNCSSLSTDACETLKGEVRAVMEEKNNYKLIAYPWEKTDMPLVLTSWGRMLEMPIFDRKAALDFISRNLNQAPEPMAD